MVHTDTQFEIANKEAKKVAKKAGKVTRFEFDSDTAMTSTVIIYLDGIDQDCSVAVELQGTKIVRSWIY